MSVEDLTERVRAAFAGKKVAEQKMFGGTAFMVQGKMAVSASKRGLLVRVGANSMEAALKRKGTRPMIMGKRVMAGYVFVDDEGTKAAKDVANWIRTALDHVGTLPAKKREIRKPTKRGKA
jgi:TfoX/Sxy family transcriptional regulator of competence genes